MSEKEEKKIQNKSMKKSRSLSRSPSLSSLSLSSTEKKIIPSKTRKRRNRKKKNRSKRRNNDKPVTLLRNTELFQVSFNETQLQKYTPITNVNSSASSFINTSILLGLIDENEAKKELRSIDKRDILTIESKRMLEKNFGLPEGTFFWRSISSYNKKDQGADDLNKQLNEELKLNNATIIILNMFNNNKFPANEGFIHYLIAYKKKNKGDENIITYFEPLEKRFFQNINDLYGTEVLGEKYRRNRNIKPRIDLDKILKYEIHQIFFLEYNYLPNENDVILKSKINNIEYKVPDNITKYAIDHFSDPIKVLGRHSLMQVTFTPKQFDEYQNFNIKGGETLFEGGACVIHSLFALGLRHVNNALLEGELMDTKRTRKLRQGVLNINTSKYLTNILKLPKGSIKAHAKYFFEIPEYYNQHEDEMYRILDSLLENNYATMIAVYYPICNHKEDKKEIEKQDAKTINDIRLGFYGRNGAYDERNGAHAIIAYKMNDKVQYYDPQTLSNSSSISEVMKIYTEPFLLRSFVTFHINNFEEQDDIILDNASCNIDLDISDKSDDSSYTKDRKKYDYHIDIDGREGQHILTRLNYEYLIEYYKKRIQTLEESAPISPEEMENLERFKTNLTYYNELLKELK